MKQGMRLFVKPGTFFNQLQWSSHHWMILIGFFVASAIETQLGTTNNLFLWYANFLTLRFGFDLGTALWMITFARLAFLLAAAWVTTVAVWIVGSLFGQRSSRRVLFRRLAVVFTILLCGYTAQHLSAEYEFASLLSLGLYIWGGALGYFAIHEQFRLNMFQTLVVSAFALLIVVQGWRLSSNLLRVEAVQIHSEFAKIPAARPNSNR